MRGELLRRDGEARGDSLLHRLDGRVKVVLTLFVVVYAVSLGEKGAPTPFVKFAAIEGLLLAGLAASRTAPSKFLKRFAVALPFGGPVVALQPFLVPGQTVSLLFLTVSREGLSFAGLLASRLTVSLTAVILLSTVSPLEELTSSLRGLKVPREFVALLDLFVRQLFVMAEVAYSTYRSAKSRGFRESEAGYAWRIRGLGSLMATGVVRALEKGRRTYEAMASRGYDGGASMPDSGGGIGLEDGLALAALLGVLAASELLL